MAPHAVLVSLDAPGHFNPMLELAERLEIRHGFVITVLVLPITAAARGASLARDHPGMNFVELRVDAGLGESETMAAVAGPAEDAIRRLEPPAAALIADGFFDWAQDVADKLGIVRVFFFTASTACEIVCANIFELRDRGYIPVNSNSDDESLIDFLPGLAPMHRKDLPLSFYDEHPIIDDIGRGCGTRPKAFCVVANTFQELEPVAVAAMREKSKYFPVGPLLSPVLLRDEQLPRDGLADDEEELGCMNWLDRQLPKSILYIAFGSVAVLSFRQVEQIVEALESTNQGFLWTFRTRRDFVEDAPDEDSMNKLLDRAKALGAGRIVSWAPQIHVLRHPALIGFVTHCGWNSLMEAICSGVPMLAWPCTSEQNLNSRRMVEEWKVALEVNSHGRDTRVVVDAGKVAELIGEMNGEKGEAMRESVMRLRDVLRAAHRPGGSAWESLREFAECV